MTLMTLVPNKCLAPTADEVADRIEALAARLRAGEFESLVRVVVIVDERDVQREPFCYGEPTSGGQLVGCLEYAKHAVLVADE